MARGRPRRPRSNSAVPSHAANTGYEAEPWRMADALRGSMDAAEYKHVVLGLIFLNYISDAFEERHAQLEREQAEGADPEDPDEYRAHLLGTARGAAWSARQHVHHDIRLSTGGDEIRWSRERANGFVCL